MEEELANLSGLLSINRFASNRGHALSGRVPKFRENCLGKGKNILTGWVFGRFDPIQAFRVM
jgi:hypothetical protein